MKLGWNSVLDQDLSVRHANRELSYCLAWTNKMLLAPQCERSVDVFTKLENDTACFNASLVDDKNMYTVHYYFVHHPWNLYYTMWKTSVLLCRLSLTFGLHLHYPIPCYNSNGNSLQYTSSLTLASPSILCTRKPARDCLWTVSVHVTTKAAQYLNIFDASSIRVRC